MADEAARDVEVPSTTDTKQQGAESSQSQAGAEASAAAASVSGDAAGAPPTVADVPEEDEDDEEEPIVTMDEIAKDDDDAAVQMAKLRCTYKDGEMAGYLKQSAFACLTCSAASGKPGVLCEACMVDCHTDHDTVELGSRFFKCDCGNESLFGQVECKRIPGPRFAHTYNTYDHTFQARFCSCDRPYNQAKDTMIQCVVCEDWFHEQCAVPLPAPDAFDDLVCAVCVEKFPFMPSLVSAHAVPNMPDAPQVQSMSSTKLTGREPGCKLEGCESAQAPFLPLALRNGWIAFLCSCTSCLADYEAKQRFGLLQELRKAHNLEDPFEEPVQAPPQQPVMHPTVAAQEQFQQLPAHIQYQAAERYTDFKRKLFDFLRPFAQSGAVVTKTDMQAFQESLPRANKRGRHE